MGGSALSFAKVRRHDREEFLQKLDQVVLVLAEMFQYFEVPKWIRNKQSFGDLDIVVVGESSQVSNETLIQRFCCQEIVRNGPVISFDYNELQVDLILVDSKVFRSSVDYYSWGDCGNLIGRIARHVHRDLKFGHDGLSFVLRDETNNHIIQTIPLTNNIGITLQILGFGPEWFDGFDGEEDVFQYVMDSDYFDPTIFFLHNRNHVDRVRDRKRKMYNSAIKYFTQKSGMVGDEPYVGRPCQQFTFEYLCDWFHWLPETVVDLRQTHERNKRIRKLFNGTLLSQEFFVSGPDLGDLIRGFKKYVEQHSLDDWLLRFENNPTALLNILRGIKEDLPKE